MIIYKIFYSRRYSFKRITMTSVNTVFIDIIIVIVRVKILRLESWSFFIIYIVYLLSSSPECRLISCLFQNVCLFSAVKVWRSIFVWCIHCTCNSLLANFCFLSPHRRILKQLLFIFLFSLCTVLLNNPILIIQVLLYIDWFTSSSILYHGQMKFPWQLT